jgi:lipoprotein NlpI
LSFGWLWFLISLLPVIGLVQVGLQAHADRYSYVPHVGLLVLIVWECGDWLTRLPAGRIVAGVVAVCTTAVCAYLTACQVSVWRTDGTLWLQALAVDPGNAFAHQHVGFFEVESGHPDKAIEHFEIVMEQRPEQRSRLEPLVAVCRRHAGQPRNDARMFNEVGLLYARQGYMEYARARFAQAVAIAPDDVTARNNLALALTRLGRTDEARSHLEFVLSRQPENAGAHVNLGILLENAAEYSAARDHFAAAIRLDPQDAEARQHLQLLNQRLAPGR